MQHAFHGRDLTILYDDEVCTHAANCVRTLPAVFDADRKPWIDPDGASAADAVATIKACPSGALQHVVKER